MPRGYKLSEEAKDDLRSIYFYGLEEFGEQSADEYFHSFFEKFEDIVENSLSYQSVEHFRPGYRRCTHRSDTIYYRINAQFIEIMAILGNQDTDEWL